MSERAAVHHALAKAFVELGVTDSARTHAEAASEAEPSNRYYLRMLALVAHQQKDYSRAIALYTRLVELDSGNSEYLTLLALEYMASGDFQKALDLFHRILALDPSDENTRAQVLLLEIKLKHYNSAIETLSGLIEEGEGEEKVRLQLTLGELYVETGQPAMAEKTFREIIGRNSRFAPAWLALLELSMRSEDRNAFRRDLDAFYNTAGLKLAEKKRLAELFYIRSSRDKAYLEPLGIMLAEMERRHPGAAAVGLLRGRMKMREKKPADAVGEFTAVLRKEPANIDAWEELVSALLLQKQYAKAVSAVARAKKLVSGMPMRLLVLEGYTAFQTGDTRKAIRVLEQALNRKQGQKEGWLFIQAASTLAMSYDKLGLAEKSMAMYRQILLLDPGNTLAMNNYAYLLALQGRDLQTAKKLALQAVADEPDNPVYLDTLGWVLFRLGVYQEALVHLEKAASLAPDEAEIVGHLIAVYEKLGMQDKAGKLREMIKPEG